MPDLFTVELSDRWQVVRFLNGKPDDAVVTACGEIKNACPGGGKYHNEKSKNPKFRSTWTFHNPDFDVVTPLLEAGAVQITAS